MDSATDMDLVVRAREGDAGAFETLAQRHYRTVYRAAFRWCGTREDAEDIAQDVFVKVARKIRSFAGKSSFRTWLYRITINTAKDFGRKRARRKAVETPWRREPAGGNPGETAEDGLAASQIFAAIDRLPRKQKAAALLVWAEGFTHKEAARVLECAEATVSAHIFQAREKLKTLAANLS